MYKRQIQDYPIRGRATYLHVRKRKWLDKSCLLYTSLKSITCATFNPDDLEDPAELNGTDLAVIDGKIGVAENGAVWIEQDVKQRAIYFIAEKLVILLDKNKIVNNMHEA